MARRTTLTLLVALAMLAVVPHVRAFAFDARATQQADAFIATLQYAQAEALRRGMAVSIAPRDRSQGFAGGWQVWEDADANGEQDRGESVLRDHEPLAAGTLASAGSLDVLTFLPSGFLARSTSLARTFHLCSGESGRTIQLNIAGRARTSRHEC